MFWDALCFTSKVINAWRLYKYCRFYGLFYFFLRLNDSILELWSGSIFACHVQKNAVYRRPFVSKALQKGKQLWLSFIIEKSNVRVQHYSSLPSNLRIPPSLDISRDIRKCVVFLVCSWTFLTSFSLIIIHLWLRETSSMHKDGFL